MASKQKDAPAAHYGSLEDTEMTVEITDETTKSSCADFYPAGFKRYVIKLLKLAWPIVIIQLTQFGYTTVGMMFCGHLGKVELDGMALAISLINVTGMSVAVGLASACDTLFSQIYGSSNKKLAGVVLQRSVVIMSLVTLPCWAVHLNIEPLMILLGQDPEVSRLAGEYILVYMPAFLFFFNYACLSKYLLNQNVVMPSMIINIVLNILNAVLHYVFLFQLGMGIHGSALSLVIVYGLSCFANLAFIMISGIYKETWPGWTWDLFQEWGMFFKIALFGLVMVCMEWWSFEIGIIVSGLLGPTALGAQSIVFQFNVIFYMIPSGMGIATSIMTGQKLGSAEAMSAKTSARVGITLAICLGIICGIIMASCRNYLPYVYTDVPEIVELVASVIPVLGLYFSFGFTTTICSGIIRATGRQNMGALIVSTCYAVALSTGIPGMLLSGEIIAFWGAQAATILLQVTCYFTLILRMDWDRQVSLALERAKVVDKIRKRSIREAIGEMIGEAAAETPAEEKDTNESTALLSDSADVSKLPPVPVRKYSAYEPPQPVLVTKRLSLGQLLLRRGLIFFIFTALLIASIIIRIEVPVPRTDSSNLEPNVTYSTIETTYITTAAFIAS